MIRFACPNCAKEVRIPREEVGSDILCPYCRQPFEIARPLEQNGRLLTSLSLLDRLRTQPDDEGWRRLDALYRPLIRQWLMRDPTLRDEAEDLVQEVLTVLVRELPHFQRERPGSFRFCLRPITFNRLPA